MSEHIKTYDAFDIIKVHFPFADKDKYKKRPALIISPPKLLGAPMGTSLVTMITSVDPEKRPWGSDVLIEDLEPTNLKHASFIRFKIFTLDRTLIEDRIGFLGKKDIKSVKERLAELFSFNPTPVLDKEEENGQEHGCVAHHPTESIMRGTAR